MTFGEGACMNVRCVVLSSSLCIQLSFSPPSYLSICVAYHKRPGSVLSIIQLALVIFMTRALAFLRRFSHSYNQCIFITVIVNVQAIATECNRFLSTLVLLNV